MIQPEPKYTGTEGHLALTRLLEDLGYVVEEEREFSPYSVDCYVERLHVAFEFDGPHHSKRRDEKRDDRLMAWYALPVIRVDVQGREAMLGQLVTGLLRHWESSAAERANLARVSGANEY